MRPNRPRWKKREESDSRRSRRERTNFEGEVPSERGGFVSERSEGVPIEKRTIREGGSEGGRDEGKLRYISECQHLITSGRHAGCLAG